MTVTGYAIVLQLAGTLLLAIDALRLPRLKRLRDSLIDLTNTPGERPVFDREGTIVDRFTFLFGAGVLTALYAAVSYVTVWYLPGQIGIVRAELWNQPIGWIRLLWIAALLLYVGGSWLLSVYFVALIGTPILNLLMRFLPGGLTALVGLALCICGLVVGILGEWNAG